ncbi:hypothetical protein Lfu02_64120 [Longispora fulva]|uniref:Uncharacterized protein n=1 Tax=Longispora fulva TaxID=619741 RepID=A0A8J7KQT9_9ACTN|nr:hypothetical protein [Longispora fulva]MBG6137802.1 hypothetical protein [Longispora fulva]GIG62040.1 hypothetical protein Lfu02_64120 [Longispora fulva]
MNHAPACTAPFCANEELSVARFTAEQLRNFTALARARVKPVPCPSYPGEYHTVRRADTLAGMADWALITR